MTPLPAAARHRPAAETAFAALFFLALGFALYFPALTGGDPLYSFDLQALAIPFAAQAREAVASGEWPLWNPRVLGGMPAIAGSNLYFLHPFDLLANVFSAPLPLFFYWDFALHAALAGYGLYLFARALGLSFQAGLLGGLFFALSGSVATGVYGGYVNLVRGAALIPWAFWGVQAAVKGRRVWGWAVVAAALALQVLAIATQVFAYLVPTLALYAFGLAHGGGPRADRGAQARALGALAGSVVLALLLSAPQWLLTLEYMAFTQRGDLPYWVFITGSFSPAEAVSWFVPGLFGYRNPYYHGSMDNTWFSEAFGLLPWVLAAAAWAAWRKRVPAVAWFAVLAGAAFVLAWGKFSPFHYWIHHLPVYGNFRIWSRTLVLVTFAVCVLAAHGWDAIEEERRDLAVMGAGIAALFTGLLAAGAFGSAKAVCFEAVSTIADLEKRALAYDHLVTVARDSARFAMVMAPLCLLAVLFKARSGKRAAAFAFVAAVALHVHGQWGLFRHFHVPQPIDKMYGVPASVVKAVPQPGLEPWRVHDRGNDHYPNNHILMGHESLSGRHSLVPNAWTDIALAFHKREEAWLDLMNVRWDIDYRGGGEPTLRERPSALPRAWWAESAVSAPDQAAALKALKAPGFDHRRSVSLEVPAPPLGGKSPIRWTARSPNAFTLEVAPERPGLLVVSNNWYPSWRCSIDGVSAAVLRADGALSAVAVPAGARRIEFRFSPARLHAGLAAAGLGLLACAGLLLAAWRRRSP